MPDPEQTTLITTTPTTTAVAEPEKVEPVKEANPVAPVTSPASVPGEESWRDSLDEAIRNDPSLKAFSDKDAVIKSYVHAQKLIGKDKYTIPDKYSSKEEVESHWRRLGKPESLEKYSIEVKDGAKIDKDFFSAFKQAAYENNILPESGQKMFDWYEGYALETQKKMDAKAQVGLDEDNAALKTEWGDAFETNVKKAQLGLSHFADEKMLAYFKETGLDREPILIRLFEKVGSSLNEDVFRGDTISNLGITPEDAKSKISEVLGNPKHPYADAMHPEHKGAVKEMEGWFKASVT